MVYTHRDKPLPPSPRLHFLPAQAQRGSDEQGVEDRVVHEHPRQHRHGVDGPEGEEPDAVHHEGRQEDLGRISTVRGGEGTVDSDAVASNRSTGSCLSNFSKMLSSRKARIAKFEIDEGFQPYHPPSDTRDFPNGDLLTAAAFQRSIWKNVPSPWEI